MNPLFRRIFARPTTVTRPSSPKGRSRRQLLELVTLEDRATPATLTVSLPGDSAMGTVDTADPTGNSGDLRYVITRSNSLGGPDVIQFDSSPSGMFGGFTTAKIIDLTSALPTITGNLTINGPDLFAPLIDPFSWRMTVNRIGTANFSIFTIGQGVDVTFNDFRITGGNNINGGGISVPDATGTVVRLNHMQVENNRTANGATTPASPGIPNPTPGAPTPIGQGGGGGIYLNGLGELRLSETAVNGNTAFEGGGIFLGNGARTFIERSAIYSNVSGAPASTTSTSGGGGIYAGGNPAEFLIVNSTIASNSAGSDGGGILLAPGFNAVLELRNSTMSQNSSNNLNLQHGGGGIANLGSATIRLYSSILRNTAASNPTTSAPKDILTQGTVQEAFSAIFDLNGGSGTITPSPYGTFSLNTNRNQVDPVLGPLQYNGGRTLSVQPFANSPIINLGDNSVAPQLQTDQRGSGFVRGAAPGQFGTTTPDMGSIEVQPPKVIIITPETASPTNSSSVLFTVYFNQPVTNLVNTNFRDPPGPDSPDATGTINENFIIVGTPTGVPSTINPSSPFFAWRVPLTSINGDGTVTINMTNSAGANPGFILAGNAANALPFIPTAQNPINPQTGQPYPGDIVIDQTRPLLISINTNPPTNPPPVPSGPLTWTITFNENVRGLSPANFGFTTFGSAAPSGALTVAPVSPLPDGSSATWTVTTNFTGNGNIGLNLVTPNGIIDRATNALAGTFPRIGPDYIVGRPIVLSITPTVPATNQTTADFVVTFNQPVSGVSVNNFSLNTTNISSANITGVTPATGFNTQYTVNVAIGGLIDQTQNGSMFITLDSSTGTNPVIAEVDPNPPFPGFDGTPIVVDFINPTLQDITKLTAETPFGNATNSATVQFMLTFSEAVPALPLNTLQLTGSVSGASITGVTSTGPNTFTVTVSVPLGQDGTLGLNVVSPAGILDSAGNTVGNIPPAFDGPDYNADRISPTITAVALLDPNPTNAPAPNFHQLRFNVVFSEPVFGLSASNFRIFEAGSGYNGTGILSVTPTGPTTYEVTIDSGLEEGTLGLELNNTTNLTDKGGSTVTNVGFQQDIYTVDTILPAVTSFVTVGTSQSGSDASSNQPTVTYEITFRETVNGLAIGNFQLASDASVGGASITGVTGSGTTYQVTVATGTGDGNIQLTLVNSIGLGDGLNNPVPVPVDAPPVVIDKTQPVIVGITQTDPPVINSPVVRYRVQFSETITGISPANFSLLTSGLTGANIPPTAVTVVPNTNGTQYDVSVVTGTGTGTLQLLLSNPTGIVDTSGNPLTVGADGPIYTIDLSAPTVLSITPVGSAFTNAATAQFDVQFSDKVSGVTAANFNLTTVGGLLGAAIVGQPVSIGDGSLWRVTVSTGTNDGTIQVNLTNPAGMSDSAGNSVIGLPAIGQPLTVDKTAPSASIAPAPSQPVPAFGEPVRFTVTFSEPVFGFGSGGLLLGGSSGVGIATVTGTAGGTTYSVTVTGLTQSGQVTVSVVPSASADAAGNASQASSPASIGFNRPVPANPDQYTTNARTPISVGAAQGVLANDGDGVSPARIAVLVAPPDAGVGSVTLAADGSFTFIPAPGFSGPAVFTYTATDGVGISAPTPVTITVGPKTIRIATSAGAGGGPQVTVLDDQANIIRTFFAYDPSFTGGVQVAAGDVTGDSVEDVVVGTGIGGGPNVVVFDGVTGAQMVSFFAYESTFRGGVQVAAGDVNNDGFDDIITGTGVTGGPRIQVFSGKDMSLLANFFAYAPDFRGGVNVAAGDVDGDGIIDILASPVAGGGPHISVFKGGPGGNFPVIRSFYAFEPSFFGGVAVAVGDVFGDGTPDIIAATSEGSTVRAFNAITVTPVADIVFADPQPTGGIRLAAKDTDNNGLRDLLVMGTGPGVLPRVERFNLTTMTRVDEVIDFPLTFAGGIYVG